MSLLLILKLPVIAQRCHADVPADRASDDQLGIERHACAATDENGSLKLVLQFVRSNLQDLRHSSSRSQRFSKRQLVSRVISCSCIRPRRP